MMSDRDWIGMAREQLWTLRDRTGAWGYRTECVPNTETTALAGMGLWCSQQGSFPEAETAALGRAAEWLRGRQRSDGGVSLSTELPGTDWATPHAILFWEALGFERSRRRQAAEWLLTNRGLPVETSPDQRIGVVGHDPTLIGWPWIHETHSWLEPTAMAVLALIQEGLKLHPRVLDGTRLILDRSLRHGGWNYGNTTVFGRELRPQPGPTGQALVALAAAEPSARPHCVDPAVSYLVRVLPETQAPISLAWGVLGLRAWNACPVDARTWLAGSFATHHGRRDAATGLGLLLMAAAELPFPTIGSLP